MADEKKKILVIDDEPDICTFISTLLEDNGYQTVTANNGVEAGEKLKEGGIDLITLDVTMPEKSGVGFYRDTKQSDQYKDIPIIIVTGISKEFENFISSRKQVPPPEGYLAKPIDQNELLALVQKLST